jgi:tRNA splicing endonuclease
MDVDEKRKIVRAWILDRGFHVRDGMKYGLDYLVYTDDPRLVHSKYGVLVDHGTDYASLVLAQRVCNSTNKILLVGLVDEDKTVRFIVCKRFLERRINKCD